MSNVLQGLMIFGLILGASISALVGIVKFIEFMGWDMWLYDYVFDDRPRKKR